MENNIEFLIDGTNGGYRVFYKTEKMPSSIAKEVRSNSIKPGNPLGQKAYAITFTDNGCAFTQYIIIYDQLRGAIGNVGFTIFFNSERRLSGRAILDLLNKMADSYSRAYIKEDKLGDVRENWEIFKKLVSEYSSDLKFLPSVEKIYPGVKEAAYIYYEDDNELALHFDDPFRHEFNGYRYILFVDRKFKNSSTDPKSAILHDETSDLTEKIDVHNTRYTLKVISEYKRRGYDFSIKAGNTIKADNDFIFKNDDIRIECGKKYYEPSVKRGNIHDEDIKQFLQINENLREIRCPEPSISLTKEKKGIRFILNKSNNQQINLPQLSLKPNVANVLSKQVSDGDVVSFEGEEIGYTWEITSDAGSIGTIKPEEHRGNEYVISSYQVIITITANSKYGEAIDNLKLNVKGSLNDLFRDLDIQTGDNVELKVNRSGSSKLNFNVKKKDVDKTNNSSTFELKKVNTPIPVSIPEAIANGNFPKNTSNRVNRVSQILYPALAILVVGIIVMSVLLYNSKRKEIIDVLNYCNSGQLNIDKLEGYRNKYRSVNMFQRILFPRIKDTKSEIQQAIELSEIINNANILDIIDAKDKLSDESEGQSNLKASLKNIDKADTVLIANINRKLLANESLDLNKLTKKIDSVVNNKHSPMEDISTQSKQEKPQYNTSEIKDQPNSLHRSNDSNGSLSNKVNAINNENNDENALINEFWKLISSFDWQDKSKKSSELKQLRELKNKYKNFPNPSNKLREYGFFLEDIDKKFDSFKKLEKEYIDDAAGKEDLSKLKDKFNAN